MKFDITRDTFRPERHFSSVRLEQGRVQLDADWNEQIAIEQWLSRAEGKDVIGDRGAPKHDPGFAITLAPGGGELLIDPGHFYVDGILCELEGPPLAVASFASATKAVLDPLAARAAGLDASVDPTKLKLWFKARAPGKPPVYTWATAYDPSTGTLTVAQPIQPLGPNNVTLRAVAPYSLQPDLSPAKPTFAVGTQLAYLDVWERPITALEDPSIREVALGGAETATRTKTVWQVKLLSLGAGVFDCDTPLPAFDTLTAPPTGRLQARAKQDPAQTDPCTVPVSAGFRRLENQLYRVEIHDAGTLGSATFVWSRDNGSVASTIVARTPDVIVIDPVPRDEEQGFAPGQWVEVNDEKGAESFTPGQLVKLLKVVDNQLTIDPATTLDPKWDPTKTTGLIVRRWDLPQAATGAITVSNPGTDDGYLKLEDGVQVKFSAGSYQTGDYWLIPARTVLGDVEWPQDSAGPAPLLRRGVKHHYARLALVRTSVSGAGLLTDVLDCRPLFPPLNDIAASDVSVDGSNCKTIAKAKTVQDAIDILCHERDLSFHNQHLHGWGIVCGLQVYCGPDTPPQQGQKPVHDTVTVKNGYAIDSQGTDIIVDAKDAQGKPADGDHINVLQLLRDLKLLLKDPTNPKTSDFITGSVMLTLKAGATVADRYGLELYDPSSNSWKHILDNTFLWDVYNDCIVPLISAFVSEFTGEEAWEHIISLLNVAFQVIFPQSGQNLFISPEEDQILREFYNKLRGIIQSKTFCAEFDGRGFPDYNKIYSQSLGQDNKPSTIFSNAVRLNQRMRLHTTGNYAFLVGTDEKIQVFDVAFDTPTTDAQGNVVFPNTHEKQVAIVSFPTAGAKVVDVAFSKNGATLYALATLNNSDSLWATATITMPAKAGDPPTITWVGAVTTICSFQLVTLGHSLLQDTFWAIGLGDASGNGAGLYSINPAQLVANQQPKVAFPALGQLVIADLGQQSFAFATVSAGKSDFNEVRRIDLTSFATASFKLPGTNPLGSSDLYGQPITVSFNAEKAQAKLFAVADTAGSQTSKQLIIWDALPANNTPGAPQTVSLQWTPPPSGSGVDQGRYYLEFDAATGRVLAAATDQALIKWYNAFANPGALDGPQQGGPAYAHPTQLAPVGLAYDPTNKYVFVMNAFSMTINNIPASYFGKDPPVIILSELQKYHKLVLEAFFDLLGALLQYLKDCFCDHFLVKCPDDTLKTIYLARIDIDKQQVANICNFSKRKYVHSFPTVEYWLSIIPILPAIKKLIGDACCYLLPPLFKTLNAPDATKKTDLVYSSQALNGIGFVNNLNLGGLFNNQVLSRFNLLSGLAKSSAVASTSKPAPTRTFTPNVAVQTNQITGQPTASAQKTLTDKQVNVTGTEVFVPSTHTVDALAAPTSFTKGDNVVLLTDASGKVIGARKATATPSPALFTAVTGHTAELAQPAETISTALAKRDAQIGQLKDSVTQLNQALASRDDQIAQLSARLDALTKSIAPPPKR
jgi:hypothetical protein